MAFAVVFETVAPATFAALFLRGLYLQFRTVIGIFKLLGDLCKFDLSRLAVRVIFTAKAVAVVAFLASLETLTVKFEAF